MWTSYQTPASIEEALRLLAERGSAARMIAGGTDLLVELRRATRGSLELIDVSRMDGMDEIWLDDHGMIHLGPAVTHNRAAASLILAARGIPLSLASSQVGTPQVRNRGTIAGNLITASPANDTITALWALDARLSISSVRGKRVLSFPDFYRSVRRTALRADEMVTDIEFPALKADQRGIFLRLGLRRANTIAMVNAAVVLTFSGEAVIRARIALGCVAPTIIRAAEAEKTLEGKRLSPECIAEAAGLAAQASSPITDVRSGAEYRREAVRVLVGRALTTLRDHGLDATSHAPVPRLWGHTDGRFRAWEGRTLCHRDNGMEPIEFKVNGEKVSIRGAGGKRLIDLLRDDLALTGTKEGCGEGECGACTIRMDGISVLACLVPAPRAHGTDIVTVEGLAVGEELHPLQHAFIKEGAVQCGFCTPGFVMAAASLLDEIPHPSCGQISSGLSGNLCRCTGYYSIMRAVEMAAAGKGDL